MKHSLILTGFLLVVIVATGQQQNSKTRFVTGLSAPELLHIGITQRLANWNQLGFTAGLGPSAGTVWWAFSLEDRIYIGKNDTRSGWKTWFIRVGTTYFPQANETQKFSFNFTGGKDLPFKKNPNNGITLDAGVFYIDNSESSSVILVRAWSLWPAIRFQLYFGL